MALFENFPYTNLHELNLDWLIQEMKELEQKVQDGPVVSVNGQTGVVTLYRESNIQFPDINDATVTKWEMFRYLNGSIYGIQFDNNGNVYALRDFARTKLLTWDDIPPEAGVISINGLYGVVHISGTDIPYMGGETATVYDKLSDLDDDITSAQADINELSVTLTTVDNAIKRGIAYLESTDTAVNNIPAGKYVFWKNGAYIATSAISAGDTLSSTNLSAVATGGFINALKDELLTQITTLNNNLAKSETTDVSTATGVTKIGFNAKKQLKVVYVKGAMQKTLTLNTWNLLCTLPAGYRPSELLECAFINGTMDNPLRGKIESNGELSVYPTSKNSSESVANILFYATFIN